MKKLVHTLVLSIDGRSTAGDAVARAPIASKRRRSEPSTSAREPTAPSNRIIRDMLARLRLRAKPRTPQAWRRRHSAQASHGRVAVCDARATPRIHRLGTLQGEPGEAC